MKSSSGSPLDSLSPPTDDNSVWTGSNLRRLWLVKVRGYSVQQVRFEPKGNLLGEVSYRKRWLLRRGNGKSK